jgi:hypothetical protein
MADSIFPLMGLSIGFVIAGSVVPLAFMGYKRKVRDRAALAELPTNDEEQVGSIRDLAKAEAAVCTTIAEKRARILTTHKLLARVSTLEVATDDDVTNAVKFLKARKIKVLTLCEEVPLMRSGRMYNPPKLYELYARNKDFIRAQKILATLNPPG